jgi:hypothetical protein
MLNAASRGRGIQALRLADAPGGGTRGAVCPDSVRYSAEWPDGFKVVPEASSSPIVLLAGAVSTAVPTAPTRHERWPRRLPHPNVGTRRDLRKPRAWIPGGWQLVPKGAHLSRGTPLSLGRRAVSLPQASAAKSRLTITCLAAGRESYLAATLPGPPGQLSSVDRHPCLPGEG